MNINIQLFLIFNVIHAENIQAFGRFPGIQAEYIQLLEYSAGRRP